MFEESAQHLSRKDWSAGAHALLMAEPDAWTVQDVGKAVLSLAAELRNFTQELSQVLGNRSVPAQHSALRLQAFRSQAPLVDPMSTATTPGEIWAPLRVVNGDARVSTTGMVGNGAGAVVQGPVVILPSNNIQVRDPQAAVRNKLGLFAHAARFRYALIDNMTSASTVKATYVVSSRILRGPSLATPLFDQAHFRGSDSAWKPLGQRCNPTTIGLPNVSIVGSSIGSDGTIARPGTYQAFAQITARNVFRSSDAMGGKSYVVAYLLKDGVQLKPRALISVSNPYTSTLFTGSSTVHAPGQTVNIAALFTASNQKIQVAMGVGNFSAVTPAHSDRWRADNGNTSLVLVKMPT